MMRINDLLLERAAVNDLDEGERSELERRMTSLPDHAVALAELRADNARILAALPPSTVSAEVARRRRARNVTMATRAPKLATFAAVSCALAFVVLGNAPRERPKGRADLALTVWRHAGDQAERLADGALVSPGELVQLTYASAGRTHGVIVAFDGAGHASLVFPARTTADTKLSAVEAALEDALEIDDAPGFERFVFVVADAPLDPRSVLEAAQTVARDPSRARNASLDVAGAAQTSVTLLKEKK